METLHNHWLLIAVTLFAILIFFAYIVTFTRLVKTRDKCNNLIKQLNDQKNINSFEKETAFKEKENYKDELRRYKQMYNGYLEEKKLLNMKLNVLTTIFNALSSTLSSPLIAKADNIYYNYQVSKSKGVEVKYKNGNRTAFKPAKLGYLVNNKKSFIAVDDLNKQITDKMISFNIMKIDTKFNTAFNTEAL